MVLKLLVKILVKILVLKNRRYNLTIFFTSKGPVSLILDFIFVYWTKKWKFETTNVQILQET